MDYPKFLIFVAFTLQNLYLVQSSCGSDLEKKLLSQLFVDYNKAIRPPPGEEATVVTANAAIRSIVWVDEKKHQWKVDLFFQQQWHDPRLQYSNLLLDCPHLIHLSLTDEDSIKNLWKPNLFFTTQLEGSIHNVLQPNIVARIFPNGDVLYSVHVSVVLYCSALGSRPTEFLCPMALHPYGSTHDEIVLRWLPKDALQIERNNIILDDFTLGEVTTRVEDTVTITGRYSTLVADFHFLKKTCMV